MKHNFLLATAVLLMLQACGGGSTGVSGGTGSDSSQSLTVAGIAAKGAPLANATVQIYDQNGRALLATPALVGSDGSYSAVIPAGAAGPFVFEVDNGSEKLISVLADKSTSTVNITPVSHLVASKLSPTGNPYLLATEIADKSATVTTASTTAAVNTIMTALRPLSNALELDAGLNPLNNTFVANGAGFDKMLDSLDVKIEPKGTASQIEITVKQSVDESTDLPKISFASTATPAAVSVDRSKLVPTGLTPKIQALLNQLTACYQVPLADRITANGTSAAAIRSATCKSAFVDGDPARYLSGGLMVSKTQHFAGMFTAESTAGVTFSDPQFLYQVGTTVANGPRAGDIAFGYRWKDDYGNFLTERNMARLNANGNLQIVGNQYRYDIGVGPYSQRRNFVLQNESNFHSVGYSFAMSCYQLNQSKALGQKIIKVNVTPPGSTQTLTFLPNVDSDGKCNYSYMVLAFPKDSRNNPTFDRMGDPSTPSTTGFIRLQSQYETGPTTAENHPKLYQKFLAFAEKNGADFTNADIEAIPQFGTWKFEYYTATDAGSTPVATQYFKTTARSMTVDGMKKLIKLPQLSAQTAAKLADSVCLNSFYCYQTQPTGPFSVSWTSSTDPGLAPAIYQVRIYGRHDKTDTTTQFSDLIRLRSSARTANIRCGEGQDSVVQRCVGATPSVAEFKSTTSIDTVDLISRAPDGTDVSHIHSIPRMK